MSLAEDALSLRRQYEQREPLGVRASVGHDCQTIIRADRQGVRERDRFVMPGFSCCAHHARRCNRPGNMSARPSAIMPAVQVAAGGRRGAWPPGQLQRLLLEHRSRIGADQSRPCGKPRRHSRPTDRPSASSAELDLRIEHALEQGFAVQSDRQNQAFAPSNSRKFPSF